MSISTTLPPATVNPITEKRRPSARRVTTPMLPFTRTTCHPEHIVEHEGQTFRRIQFLEDDKQRDSHRVREHRVGFRIITGAGDHGIGDVRVQGILPARRSRAQHVQTHPRHDRRQPSAQVVDTTDIAAAESDPGFLDGVLRLADRPEHPIGDRPHVRSVRFELVGWPLRCGHRSSCS